MLNYLLFSEPIDHAFKPIIKSGLYCWLSVFRSDGSKGDMQANVSKDVLEQYDIVHVNFTPGHRSYIEAIRNALGEHSSTRLVANIDYAVSMWEGINPFDLKRQLLMADHVFHVESLGAKNLSRLLGKDVPVIPHPVDVNALEIMAKSPGNPRTITCQYHRYQPTWSSYYYALLGVDARKVLCNLGSNVPKDIDMELYFDRVFPQMDYCDYIKKILARSSINLDLAPDRTAGRGVCDAAALGVPTIGSSSIESAHRLFPDLMVDPFDHGAIRDMVDRLISDRGFADEVSKRARSEVTWYGLEESKNRMMVMLNV